jgi:hypothetical protein
MTQMHTGRDSRPVCAACGQPLKSPRAVCCCGHPETGHEINRAGARTWCASYSPKGPCDCKAFLATEGD